MTYKNIQSLYGKIHQTLSFGLLIFSYENLSLVSLDFLVILFVVVIPDIFLMPKSYRGNFILPTVQIAKNLISKSFQANLFQPAFTCLKSAVETAKRCEA